MSLVEAGVEYVDTEVSLGGQGLGDDLDINLSEYSSDMVDPALLDNFRPDNTAGMTINDLYFPHGSIEVTQRASNAVFSLPTRGSSKGNYAFRSKYSENIFTITIPIIPKDLEALEIYATLVEDLKSFGFIRIQYDYLPYVPEAMDTYSVDEFRIHIDSDTNLHFLEIDIQPVNMSLFGETPVDFAEAGANLHAGDSFSVTTLKDIIRIGDDGRPSVADKLDIRDGDGKVTLPSMTVHTGYGKGSSEFRAFLDNSRDALVLAGGEPLVSFTEDVIAGSFDVTVKTPVIYPKDEAVYQDRPYIDSEESKIEVFDTSVESLIETGADYRLVELADNRLIPQVVVDKDGVKDYEGKDITPYFQGRTEDVDEVARRTRQFIIRWVEDFLFYDRDVHNIKQLTYKKQHQFARHFIGNSSVPMTQYIGPRPAVLSIVSHYVAPDVNSEYSADQDVPQFFNQLLSHINNNATMYPMATAFNFIKIRDNGFGFINGKYIPSEAYRVASADNSNVEVFATNFIESSMDELYDDSRYKLATEIVSAGNNALAADMIAKYLVVAKTFYDSGKGTEPAASFHATFLQRLLRLKKRIEAGIKGELANLDGFERPDSIDFTKRVGDVSEGSGAASVEGDGDSDESLEDDGSDTPAVSGKGKLIIMGDSIAVGFWSQGLTSAQRKSEQTIFTARVSWNPKHIFDSGYKETLDNNVPDRSKALKASAKGTTLPSQLSMVSNSLSGATVILSSGISNNPGVKEEDLVRYLTSLASKVNHLHVLGMATTYTPKGYSSGQLVAKLTSAVNKAKASNNNISLGPSSPGVGDKVHPSGKSHTGALDLVKKLGI